MYGDDSRDIVVSDDVVGAGAENVVSARIFTNKKLARSTTCCCTSLCLRIVTAEQQLTLFALL
jgi:hypothetical protein